MTWKRFFLLSLASFILALCFGTETPAQPREDKGHPTILYPEHEKKYLVHIETTTGLRLRGFLQDSGGDSVSLTEDVEASEVDGRAADQRTTRLPFGDIASLSVHRRSRFSTGIQAGLALGVVGALLGLADGDDPPGLISFTAGQKAGLLGSALGTLGICVGGTYGALKGVDLDIPWEGKTEAEQAAILSEVRTGTYRSRHCLAISPWAGVHSPPEGKAAPVFGGRIRYYFTPRSGLELTYAKTGWSSMRSSHHDPCWFFRERSRTSQLSGGFFIYPVRTRSVRPFVAWGWGRSSTQTNAKRSCCYDPSAPGEWEESATENTISANLSGGVEIPLTNRLSLEGRLADIWALGEGHHTAFQLGLTLNTNP
jgi:hypothetical protein